MTSAHDDVSDAARLPLGCLSAETLHSSRCSLDHDINLLSLILNESILRKRTMSNDEAASFLGSLLNKTLRIHTTDTRIFVGQMKCTDKVTAIITQSPRLVSLARLC